MSSENENNRDKYGPGWGEIESDTLYTSAEFRRRVSSGRGPMSPDTLSDWIKQGLRVQRSSDGRIWIKGEWFLEWLCEQAAVEPHIQQ